MRHIDTDSTFFFLFRDGEAASLPETGSTSGNYQNTYFILLQSVMSVLKRFMSKLLIVYFIYVPYVREVFLFINKFTMNIGQDFLAHTVSKEASFLV